METGLCEAGKYVGIGEAGDGIGAGAGTGWAAGFAESEIAGIAVVCWGDWGDCGAGKVGAGADEAVG